MLMLSGRCGLVGLLLGAVLMGAGCAGAERATVEVHYVLNPTKGLPPGLDSVAILDAQVNTVTDKKWSELAANYVEHLIQESNEKYGASLRVADRKHTSSVMKEADLAAAGLVASAKPGAVAKLLDVQGLVMTEINVKVEKHKGKGRTVDYMSLWGGGGHGWGHGGGSVDSTEVDKESRHITVQTDFKLVDAATEENLAVHSPRPYRQTDKMKVSPFFGSAKTEADMTPRDAIIGEAVELGARQFIAKLIPCAVTYLAEVESSGQENCVEGVKLLRAEMHAEAAEQFKLALAEDPSDHRAAYAAGLACEATGRYSEALEYYKKACYVKNQPEYIEARKRLSENIDHIRTEEGS